MEARGMLCAVALCATGGLCAGQVLYEAANQATAAPATSEGEGQQATATVPEAPPQLDQVSLIVVEPPEPPTFASNDLVTIIISERAKTEREHIFDSKKQYDMGGSVETWVDMLKLLELRLQQGNRGQSGDNIAEWGLGYDQKFKGDASYERDDTVTARVTARVVEVKPNGSLLLEARTVVTTDTEEQSIVLSGYCRGEDVTDANTIQSNQMFDLRLDIQNTGDVRKGAQKGVIPKVLDALFNF